MRARALASVVAVTLVLPGCTTFDWTGMDLASNDGYGYPSIDRSAIATQLAPAPDFPPVPPQSQAARPSQAPAAAEPSTAVDTAASVPGKTVEEPSTNSAPVSPAASTSIPQTLEDEPIYDHEKDPNVTAVLTGAASGGRLSPLRKGADGHLILPPMHQTEIINISDIRTAMADAEMPVETPVATSPSRGEDQQQGAE